MKKILYMVNDLIWNLMLVCFILLGYYVFMLYLIETIPFSSFLIGSLGFYFLTFYCDQNKKFDELEERLSNTEVKSEKVGATTQDTLNTQ